MKKFHCFSTIIFSLSVLQSCNYDNRYCDIKINTPVENQVFNNGDVINVNSTIRDDGDAITSEELIVTSSSNDTVLKFKEHKFTSKYTLDQNFVATSNQTYKIEVRAHGGHGNWASEVVNIKCN